MMNLDLSFFVFIKITSSSSRICLAIVALHEGRMYHVQSLVSEADGLMRQARFVLNEYQFVFAEPLPIPLV